jgi:hypothetical protein
MPSPALASLLRDGRTDLNARFQAARHRYPDLEAARFRRFLEDAVDPLVAELARTRPAATPAFLQAAYDVGLDLCGQRLVGDDARLPVLDRLWRELLPAALPLLAQAPARLLSALGNAVHQIAGTPGARPDKWLHGMQAALDWCDDADSWLRLGQVLAWRCGMSHYRGSALALADTLPAPAMAGLFGAAGQDWPALRAALARDPWWRAGARPGVVEAGRMGGFSGLGGPFPQLPRVAAVDERLFVLSGDECWLLIADRYGSTLHRATPVEAKAARGYQPPLAVTGASVRWQGHELELTDVSRIDGHALNRDTLLLTSHDTYQVILVALGAAG